MTLDKSCILFDGGKRIELSTDMNPGNEGIRFTRNDATGDWDVVIKARITSAEAKNVICKFSDLIPPPGVKFEDAFPNMPFFVAMDSNEQPIDIALDGGSDLIPIYDRNDTGTLLLKLKIPDFGKTQNGNKTQNANIGS